MVELRLDYWQREGLPPFEEAARLARGYGMDVIVTVRHPREGGVWLPPWREEAYERAEGLKAICDVELKLSEGLPCERTVASVHYFKSPPPQGEVGRLSQKAFEMGAWAFKVATVIKDELSYFAIMKESVHPRTAFMPMGPGTEGLRLASVLLGSFLNYGSVGEPTAPGQVSLSKLAALQRLLRD